jgi:hypothetical protein
MTGKGDYVWISGVVRLIKINDQNDLVKCFFSTAKTLIYSIYNANKAGS